MSDDSGDDEPKKGKATKRKAKKEKDPNAPKRPLSAFMFFCQDNRPALKQANPNANFSELGKIMGAAWKEVSEADKKPYEAKNETDKKRYDREKANYTGGAAEGSDDEGSKKTKKSKKEAAPKKGKKDKDAPKSAPSAYVLFCSGERPKLKAQHPDATFGELGTLLGAAWKALSDEDKQPFVDDHAAKKKVADAKKKAYESEHGKPAKKEKKADKTKKKDASDDEEEGSDAE